MPAQSHLRRAENLRLLDDRIEHAKRKLRDNYDAYRIEADIVGAELLRLIRERDEYQTRGDRLPVIGERVA